MWRNWLIYPFVKNSASKKKKKKKKYKKKFSMTFLSTKSSFYVNVIAIFLVFVILWNTNWKLHMSNAKKKSINYFQTHHDAFISAFPKEIFIGYECIFSSLTLHTQICHCDKITKKCHYYINWIMITLTKFTKWLTIDNKCSCA